MTEKEAKEMFDEMKAQGRTDEDILGALYMLYKDEKIDTDDLRALLRVLGYEFTDEFEAMSEEDKHTKGMEKEITKTEEKAEVEDDGKKEEVVEEEKKEDDDDEDKEVDEEEEEKRANKLFGFKD